MTRIALVTSSQFPDLVSDDQLLLADLEGRGLQARPVVWDGHTTDWASFSVAVIRSTWDYHLRREEFVAWAERAGCATQLWNPAPVVRWNTDKSYLLDLEARGVPIVPTAWLGSGSDVDLSRLLDERGWERAVIKPAISADAFETVLIDVGASGEGQAHLDRLLPTRDMMVQPFFSSVLDYGEHSLLYIAGEYSHTVARASPLAEQEAFSHEHRNLVPPDEEVALAGKILRAAGYETLYARVDLVRDDEDRPRLLELELVEPYLFLAYSPEAVERLADAIAARGR